MIFTFHISSHGRIEVGFSCGRPNIVKVICVLFTSPGAVSGDRFRSILKPFYSVWKLLRQVLVNYNDIALGICWKGLNLFIEKFKARSLGKSTGGGENCSVSENCMMISKSNQAANEITQNWPVNSITCAWIINSSAADLGKKWLFFYPKPLTKGSKCSRWSLPPSRSDLHNLCIAVQLSSTCCRPVSVSFWRKKTPFMSFYMCCLWNEPLSNIRWSPLFVLWQFVLLLIRKSKPLIVHMKSFGQSFHWGRCLYLSKVFIQLAESAEC